MAFNVLLAVKDVMSFDLVMHGSYSVEQKELNASESFRLDHRTLY